MGKVYKDKNSQVVTRASNHAAKHNASGTSAVAWTGAPIHGSQLRLHFLSAVLYFLSCLLGLHRWCDREHNYKRC